MKRVACLLAICLLAANATATQPETGPIRGTIEQAQALGQRLKPAADAGRLDPLVVQLEKLATRLDDKSLSGDQLAEIGRQARQLKRSIALCNPLLDFDKLLFIKRHDAGGVYHMCDQYYGCNARPGGGLFVLNDPFGDNPTLTNVLENSLVENGRLKGQKLDSGSFLSPELSFDGKTILFAYSQCKATKTYTWAAEFSYHIFKVNVDGSNLVQLTDGEWDDFDPCFLPGGRIAFVSLRRGGYLRCGRHCPVYALCSMESDGSDITNLSYHETHEWHPSVNNDGMLVYTR